ncbi:unnamed protein product, partial [Polarella glacialis]
ACIGPASKSSPVDGGLVLEHEADAFEDRNSGPATLVLHYRSYVDMFCSARCCESFAVKRSPAVARVELERLEGGVCQKCGLNTRRLLESLRRLPPGAARAAFLGVASAAPGAEAVTSLPAQRQFFARLREKRRQRLLQTKKLQSCHFWEADH